MFSFMWCLLNACSSVARVGWAGVAQAVGRGEAPQTNKKSGQTFPNTDFYRASAHLRAILI